MRLHPSRLPPPNYTCLIIWHGPSVGVVMGDCLRGGGGIIEKLHHFFCCLLGAFWLFSCNGDQCDYHFWVDCACIIQNVPNTCWTFPASSGFSSRRRLWGVPVGVLWNHNLMLSAGEARYVVCLGWVVGICGVRVSRILVLRSPVVWWCNLISVVFLSIPPLTSFG